VSKFSIKEFNSLAGNLTDEERKEKEKQFPEFPYSFDGEAYLNSKSGDKIIAHYKNTFAYVGDARENGLNPFAEFGGANSQEIRFVAGAGGGSLPEKTSRNEPVAIASNPQGNDGATFLLTTKIDHRLGAFGLKTDQVDRLPTAFAGLKSDNVAIVATNDVIIATGVSPEDYHKRRSLSTGRIIMNPGNKEMTSDDKDNLFSVPNGELLNERVNFALDVVDEVLAQIQELNVEQNKMMKILMNHTHFWAPGAQTAPSILLQTEGPGQMMKSAKREMSMSGLRAKILINSKVNSTKAGKDFPLSRQIKLV